MTPAASSTPASQDATLRGRVLRVGYEATRAADAAVTFCVYVADHYVLPELSGEQIEAIRDSRLSMDSLVREKIHAAFGFRFVVVEDYKTAIQVENLVKSGRLQAGRPRLNPSR
jgi:hypothetical protein